MGAISRFTSCAIKGYRCWWLIWSLLSFMQQQLQTGGLSSSGQSNGGVSDCALVMYGLYRSRSSRFCRVKLVSCGWWLYYPQVRVLRVLQYHQILFSLDHRPCLTSGERTKCMLKIEVIGDGIDELLLTVVGGTNNERVHTLVLTDLLVSQLYDDSSSSPVLPTPQGQG